MIGGMIYSYYCKQIMSQFGYKASPMYGYPATHRSQYRYGPYPARGAFQYRAAGYKPRSAGYQATSSGYRATYAGHQATFAGYQTTSTGYQATSAGYQATSASYQATYSGYQAREKLGNHNSRGSKLATLWHFTDREGDCQNCAICARMSSRHLRRREQCTTTTSLPSRSAS